jgi:DNA-binding PadR family transcriptional regulator
MWSLEEILGRINELDKLGGLRFMTLHVLRKEPKTGTEIIDAIQWHRKQVYEVLENHYPHQVRKIENGSIMSFKPSSGSVYPMLKKLAAEGLIIKKSDGKYELTEAGNETNKRISGSIMQHSLTEPIDRSAIAIETALNEIDSYLSFLEDINKKKLIIHEKRLENFIERLQKIKKNI